MSGIFSGTGGVLGGYAEEQAALAKRFGAPSNGASHPWGQGSGYGYRPYSMMRTGLRPTAGGSGVALGDVGEIWSAIPSWLKWGGVLFAVIALLKVKRSNPKHRSPKWRKKLWRGGNRKKKRGYSVVVADKIGGKVVVRRLSRHRSLAAAERKADRLYRERRIVAFAR